MKARYTLTLSVDIELDPTNFPGIDDPAEMVDVDVANFQADPLALLEWAKPGDIEISGELVTDHWGVVQQAKKDESFKALLLEWEAKKGALAKERVDELSLRKAIAATLFPDGNEGTNKCFVDDIEVAAVLKVNRSLDKGRLSAFAEEFAEFNINVDELITYRPELKVGPYRKLSEQQQAVFNQALTIREGAPEMEIRRKKK